MAKACFPYIIFLRILFLKADRSMRMIHNAHCTQQRGFAFVSILSPSHFYTSERISGSTQHDCLIHYNWLFVRNKEMHESTTKRLDRFRAFCCDPLSLSSACWVYGGKWKRNTVWLPSPNYGAEWARFHYCTSCVINFRFICLHFIPFAMPFAARECVCVEKSNNKSNSTNLILNAHRNYACAINFAGFVFTIAHTIAASGRTKV